MLKPGDTIPDCQVYIFRDGAPAAVSTRELMAGRTCVLFALPGAFTPTCSAAHVPSYVLAAEDLRAAGVDEVFCLSVNDAFVMHAWGEAQNVGDTVTMLADGSYEFTSAAGLTADLSARGFGIRSQRYALIARDGVVEYIAVEEPGKFEVSSAQAMLARL